jgi:hypothetical protein
VGRVPRRQVLEAVPCERWLEGDIQIQEQVGPTPLTDFRLTAHWLFWITVVGLPAETVPA